MSDKNTELYTISVAKNEDDNIFFVERKQSGGYNVFEAAFLSALFLKLHLEFHANLVDFQGEEKTYLIEEFYKLEVDDLRAVMENKFAASLRKQLTDNISKALDTVKESNADLEGYQEL